MSSPDREQGRMRRSHAPGQGPEHHLHTNEPSGKRGLILMERYQGDLNLLAEILTEESNNPDAINALLRDRLDEFSRADRHGQIMLSSRDGKVIDHKLKGVFVPNLSFLTDLLKDSNKDSDVVSGEIQTWELLFSQSSRRDRYNLTLDLMREIRTVAEANFPEYAQSLKQLLTETQDKPEKDIDKEVEELKAKFAHASPRGKIGIVKTLRERLSTASTTRFSTLLQVYGRIYDTATQKLMPPNVYKESYDQQTDPHRKREIIDELGAMVNDLLDKRPRRSRRALGHQVRALE